MPNRRASTTVRELADAMATLRLKAEDLERGLESMEYLFRNCLELPDRIRIKRGPEDDRSGICFGLCKSRQARQ